MTATVSENSWQYRALNAKNPGLDHLSNGLILLMKEGHEIVAGSADLKYSNGLNRFADAYPDRYISFGISEQNMVSVAAGLATAGVTPFIATFASFLALLACEQIRMDIAYSAQRVRLVGHHTGISLGYYGSSHHATEDIGAMRSLADLDVVSPCDGAELEAVIRASADRDRPIYIRIGRGRDPVVYGGGTEFQFGKAHIHSIGEDLTIIACGITVHAALDAATVLGHKGLSVGVINMSSIKPLDRDAIITAADGSRSGKLLSVEEHNVMGGLGSAIAEVLSDEGKGIRLKRHGIYDEYSLIAPPASLYAHYRLDGPGIAAVAEEFIRN